MKGINPVIQAPGAPVRPQTYRVIREFTEGAAAVVMLVHNQILDRLEVRKTIDMLGRQDTLPYKEPRLLEQLQHPRIVRIYDAHHDTLYGTSGFVTFSMPYYAEGSVQYALLEAHTFSLHEAVRLTVHLLEALEFLHEQAGYIHRDIKVSNGLLSNQRRNLVLADLGSAGEVEADGSVAARLGTLLYRPPEWRTGRLTRASDIYGVGLFMREILRGPFDYAYYADREDMIDERLSEGRRPMAQRDIEPPPHAPPALRRVIRRALRIDPKERYQRARDMITDLVKLRLPNWRQVASGWSAEAPQGRRYRVEITGPTGPKARISAQQWSTSTGKWRRIAGVADRVLARDDTRAYVDFMDLVSDRLRI